MHLKEGFFGGADIKKWGLVFCGGDTKESSGPKRLRPPCMN